ncbi:MAG: T9SS type A sorting domain-containing protein [Flavobacteriales bacterium]|nr:T9SS type A sorting domain-containing protein [Flavobacteriales bacterium]MBK7555675.1 T9SS type A sorting domain-containing protein [Flavobacteriales bacterium]
MRPLLTYASLSFATMTSMAQIADAGPDTTLCVDFYTMQGSPLPPGATGTWAIIAGCGSIMDMNDPLTLTVNLCVGTNVFIWTVDDNGQLDTDTLLITVFDASMANANAGMDQTIIEPQNYAFLNGTPTPLYPATCWWSWVLGFGAVTANDPNTPVVDMLVGDNILAWTCDNGPCGLTSDTVTIHMLMATGLSNADADGAPSMAYDPFTRQLRVLNCTASESLVVMDVQGRSIISASGGSQSISMTEQPVGIYVARAIVDDRSVVHRFVVTH